MPNPILETITIDGNEYDLGGAGHVIEKSDGTDMTQRSNLQFVDAQLTDDSTNDRTKIENVKIIQNESELANLPDGIYMGAQDEAVPFSFEAEDISYDNTTSQLTATDVQAAIDELSQKEAGVQSDWNEADNTKLDYIKNKPANLVQDASYVHTDNNYTSTEKTKLGTIAEGAEVNVQSDWSQSDNTADDYIKNKPTIPDAQIQSDWNQTSGTAKDYIKNKPTLGTASALDVATSGDASSTQVVKGDDSRLSDARTPVAHNHTISEITDFPTLGTASALDVATSGDASSTQVVKGDDSRLSDARTPVSHTHTLSEITDAGAAASKNSTSSVTADSTDLVESGAVKTAIDNAISGAYKHAGTKTCAELISSLLIASNNGNVYNITDSGTTTADFIEGAGIPIRAGDNVGIAKISDSIYKFDLLSGFIDTSNFVTKSSTSGLIKNDGSIDTTEYAPASSVPAAQIQSDWSQSDNTKLDYIKNKPTLGSAASKNVPSSGDAGNSEVVLGNDSRLSDARNAADVYSWAKAENKPSYTKSEVGLGNVDNTSDTTKKSNFTGSIASGNTGFVTGGDAYTELNKKVDKVDGKGLSTNDYTTTEKNKLAGITSGAEVNVQSDWNQTTNTADDYIKNKPQNLVQDASYVHTDNNYTTDEKTKLSGIAAGAEVNVQSDWSQTNTSSDDFIKNKPTKVSQFTNDSGFTKVESSETNGNIKIDTVETQVYDDSEIQELIDTDETETDYANPLSLETMQAQVAKNTKIKLEPIQDLHGYSKPWVGGAGKNKFNIDLVELTNCNVNGLTVSNKITDTRDTVAFQVQLFNDNTFVQLVVSQTINSNGKFAVGFTISSGTSYNKLRIKHNGTSQDVVICAMPFNKVGQFAISFNVTGYDPSVVGGMVFSNIQLEEGPQATSYEPYENLCPISGHDEIDILGCGKNILPMTVDGIKSANSNRTWTGNSTVINDVTFTILTDGDGNVTGINTNGTATANAQLYIKKAIGLTSGDYIINGAISSSKRIFFYDGTTWYDDYGSGKSFIISSQTVQEVAIVVANGTTVSNEVFYPMIRLSTESDSNFAPYQESNNLSIDLPSTVYGGVLDLESGELVVDRGYDSTTWGDMTDPIDRGNSITSKKLALSSVSIASSEKKISVCNMTDSEVYNTNGIIHYYINETGQNLMLFLPNTTSESANIQICYPLATPTTIQLTPHQLSLLKAQNNLTTSQYTQIKVTYRNGVFATLEELSDTANGIYNEISGDATTVSGNPINFTTREKQKSKSTIIDLEPIQDLHGFTKPWVGGAGKNLLPLTVQGIKDANSSTTWTGNSCVKNEVTFTILTDSDNNVIGVKANGTANGDAQLGLVNFTLNAGTYILNGCPTNNGVASIIVGYVGTDAGSGATGTNSEAHSSNGAIKINNGKQASNLIFYPMLRLSSVTDSTFEPYTNIASISGRSSVDIDGCGKNLLNTFSVTKSNITFAVDNEGYITATPNNSDSRAWSYNESQYKFKLYSGSYKFVIETKDVTTNASSGFEIRDSLNNMIIGSGTSYPFSNIGISTYNFTLNNDTDISVMFKIYAAIARFMIINSTDTVVFEPYTPSTDLTISFGTTVYGGRLDVEKGELIVDRGIADLGDLDWSLSDAAQHIFRSASLISTIKIPDSGTDIPNDVCSIYYIIAWSSISANTNGRFAIASKGDSYAGRIVCIDHRYSSTSDFTTGVTGQKVAYELATPTTIQLTPQQVQLLKGINNISTTGTTITVTFKNGSVAHLDDLPDFTDYDKEKLASIDTLAITLDLLTHTLVVTQDI